MSGDVIERMRERAIEVLRKHGWTVTDGGSNGETHKQLDEALEAVARVLLEDMRTRNRFSSNPAHMSHHEQTEAYARSIGIRLGEDQAEPRAMGWDGDEENRD